MYVFSIDDGGADALASACSSALTDLCTFQDRGCNIEVPWAAFGINIWWCSTEHIRKEKLEEGFICFNPAEIYDLHRARSQRLDRACFLVKHLYRDVSLYYTAEVDDIEVVPNYDLDLSPKAVRRLVDNPKELKDWFPEDPIVDWLLERLDYYAQYQDWATQCCEDSSSGICPRCGSPVVEMDGARTCLENKHIFWIDPPI